MKYEFYWPVLWQYRGLLLEGLRITIVLFLAGAVASLALGTVFGILGAGRSRAARIAAEMYVEFNRNTPLVVKLFFLYFGFGLEAYNAAIVGLALHQSAYIAEIVRSGIQSVPNGQMEAGLSSGLGRLQVMRRIILPQALVIVIPPLTTQVLETLKNTSIAMTIAIPELTFQTQQIEAYSFRGFEAATAATVMYLVLGLVIASIAVALEWWLTTHRFQVRTLKPEFAAGK
jgi:polar amino acid transport system permease protein